MRIACSGSSGSGKTTIVKFISETLNIPHISGSAGDIRTVGDMKKLEVALGYKEDGHEGVIIASANNPTYGIINQEILQKRRAEIIRHNSHFITDRSPADNLTYYVNQVGFHKAINDKLVEIFMEKCLDAWKQLDYVIFIKAVQPHAVENNGSRIHNRYYQQAIDAQFDYWIKEYFMKNSYGGPEVLTLDYWDLEMRKAAVLDFLGVRKPQPQQMPSKFEGTIGLTS